MSLRNRPNSNAKYSELPTQDPSTIEYVEEKESIAQRIVQWFHSLFWVLLCVFSWRYTKLFDVLRYDERINTTMFYFSGVLFTINVVLFVYLSLISAIISTFLLNYLSAIGPHLVFFNSSEISVTSHYYMVHSSDCF